MRVGVVDFWRFGNKSIETTTASSLSFDSVFDMGRVEACFPKAYPLLSHERTRVSVAVGWSITGVNENWLAIEETRDERREELVTTYIILLE